LGIRILFIVAIATAGLLTTSTQNTQQGIAKSPMNMDMKSMIA